MKFSLIIMMLIVTLPAIAQLPLNKRDQKAKEEFEALISAENKYNELLEKADGAFKSRDYLSARMTYQEAIPFNPEMEQWLISKVNDLDILMAKNAARSVDSIYVKVPIRASRLADAQAEKGVKSRQLEVPDLIVVSAEMDTVVEAEEVKTKIVESSLPKKPQPKPEKVLIENQTNTIEEKVKEDFTQLDDGITEETFNLVNHEVLRVLVKEGIDIKIFKQVKHNWGGEFYFLDGMDVSKRYWMEQVDLYRSKYGNTGN